MTDTELPTGVIVRDLVQYGDTRGKLCEIYRADWVPSDAFLQWNVVHSQGGVLRGVHVHPRHADYLHVVSGSMLLALHDLRPDDPAKRRAGFVTLSGDRPRTAWIPHGVAHGFWFPRPCTYVYGLSHGWSPDEEIGCRYDDPALDLDWPLSDPILSERDTAPAHNYQTMRDAWFAAQSPGGTA